MSPLHSFPWPATPNSESAPEWDGETFRLDGRKSRILVYEEERSNWSDELTGLHELEAGSNHPIDVASRKLAISSMTRVKSSAPVILDVGSSSGFVLQDLLQAFPRGGIMGSDFLYGPLVGLADRTPGVPILQFDLRKCPLPNDSIDGITCLNVLEHIDDHQAAMQEIHRILRVGGVAHIEVPAGRDLYDIYDEHLLHHRRYDLREIQDLAIKSNLKVERSTHLGCFVYPPFRWTKLRNRRKLVLTSDEKARLVAKQIRSTRRSILLREAMRLETTLGNIFNYPCGIRCVVVLRKTQP